MGVRVGGVPHRHGLGWDGNDPLLLHCSWVFIFVEFLIFCVAFRDDCSHMGGRHDMKSLVINVGLKVGYGMGLMFVLGQ